MHVNKDDVTKLVEAVERLASLLETEIEDRPLVASRTLIEDEIASSRHLLRTLRQGPEIQEGL